MYQRVVLIGNLGKDAEHKEAGNQSVTNLNVATTEKWMQDGEWKSRTSWHRVQIWGKGAERCKDFKKGELVLVEGTIQYREYEDDKGKHNVTEIKGHAKRIQKRTEAATQTDEDAPY